MNDTSDQVQAEETARKTPYERLGGREVIAAIANRFYDLMESDPAYAKLRAMHAADLGPMRESLTGFLTGWSGGPRDWFASGKCMMSMHRGLPIARETADQWAAAMARAIADVAPADRVMADAMAGVLEEIAGSMVPVQAPAD
ncbi:globin domain-containing protein [Novosphingobium sp. KACC 22771]|uniref:globin domain-containing protein n=1 Tax=Novosphingobium sp. KACC 22771 TaxID=3025670 RepID=UPI002365A42B|nr:globin [Novosphingobium sp. KACC 22771]WDF72686.1 globin [Novosphingobium sp. KACC 22771]